MIRGLEVAGSATKWGESTKISRKTQPDVVLTDIKMPYMDGLELSRRLNREYPNIYIMLCTGFDEFEYAKKQCIWKSRNICSNRSMQCELLSVA